MNMSNELCRNGEALKLSWDAVVKQFNNLVKYAARQKAQNSTLDGMLSAEDLYQEGMIKLYDCWDKWCVGENKDMDEFAPIFRKSLYRQMDNKGGGSKFTYIDLEDAFTNIEDSKGYDVVERMYRDNGMEKLKDMLSEISREFLEELIEPSEATLFQVWADTARKNMLKSQGKRINIPKDTTVRMKHIQRALGLTGKQYDNVMQEIREKAPLALQY
ncbi:hypothetical protein SHANETTE_147 [Bacillus phage Shanette]|uniref:Uncharacterized protein n=1 Tax=Bacillus phage Shanette TaxID=1296656 RepID=S5M564_9CAUD|nr:hypothetical protein AVV46_gp150 [Bacillus phage Shanette]AGR47041.1 hypothetical protein SHANETTE_147 [Bacillus phage Shanette]